MSITTADLHRSINVAWDASGLNALFQALWPAGSVTGQFPVLHDQEATPGQPAPYCVVGESASATTDRMYGGANRHREVRDVPLSFVIHATAVDGDERTAKKIAADLAEEVMKQFGGHPTVAPQQTLVLTDGEHLITQYQTDFGVREGDDEWSWTVSYVFKIDVPVMV